MFRVLLSGSLHDDGLAVLTARPDVEVVEMPDGDAATFAAMLPGADALLLRTAALPEQAIADADRLKVVSRHGVGYDNVPVAALTAKRTPLALAVGANGNTVAEHVFYLMLSIAKHGPAYDQAVRQGAWGERNQLKAFDIGGRSLLLIGFGRIGRSVALMARAFSMPVFAFDPDVTAQDMAAVGVEYVADWRAFLPEADVVSLHVPFLPETDNMIGATELAAMKSGAILINAARGGLIDEAALAAALDKGHLAGAGIDTLRQEPPSADSPLLGCERVILSPHLAGLTRESAARLSVYAARNILAALDGALDPAVVVNPSVLAQ